MAPSASQALLQGRCTVSQALQDIWFSATFTPFRIVEFTTAAAYRPQSTSKQAAAPR